MSILRKIAHLFRDRRDRSKYNVTNSGSLEICPKALAESDFFKRQIEASKKLSRFLKNNRNPEPPKEATP